MLKVDRTHILVVGLVFFGCVMMASITIGGKISDSKLYDEEIKEVQGNHRLSRADQVRIMQECYDDAGKTNINISLSFKYRLRVAGLFFIYRTGMVINNNLVQPELSQWINE